MYACVWQNSKGNHKETSTGLDGNTGCGVFKGGTKLERFLPKNQHTYPISNFVLPVWKFPQPVLPYMNTETTFW